jgi:hypothetical protein
VLLEDLLVIQKQDAIKICVNSPFGRAFNVDPEYVFLIFTKNVLLDEK